MGTRSQRAPSWLAQTAGRVSTPSGVPRAPTTYHVPAHCTDSRIMARFCGPAGTGRVVSRHWGRINCSGATPPDVQPAVNRTPRSAPTLIADRTRGIGAILRSLGLRLSLRRLVDDPLGNVAHGHAVVHRVALDPLER